MNSLRIKKGDTVMVIAGDDKGKTGVVVSSFPSEKKVSVEGVNIVSKHKKAKSAQDVGGIMKQVAKIDVSNVAVVCPECGKTTKVVFTEAEADGKTKKVRICKKCKASLEVKKAAKKTAAKRAPRKKKTEETAPETPVADKAE